LEERLALGKSAAHHRRLYRHQPAAPLQQLYPLYLRLLGDLQRIVNLDFEVVQRTAQSKVSSEQILRNRRSDRR
jgi:hypothetical protein